MNTRDSESPAVLLCIRPLFIADGLLSAGVVAAQIPSTGFITGRSLALVYHESWWWSYGTLRQSCIYILNFRYYSPSDSSMPDGYRPYLYGAFVQTLIYGIYITTLAHCLRWLLLDDEGWKSRRRINWFMLIISTLLFLLLTADLVLALKLLIDYNNLTAKAICKYNDIFVRWSLFQFTKYFLPNINRSPWRMWFY